MKRLCLYDTLFLFIVLFLVPLFYSCQKSTGADPASNVNYSIPICTVLSSPSPQRNNKWPIGSTLRIKFLNGDTYAQGKVKYYADIWHRYANINFTYVGVNEESDIRIGFRYKNNLGTWCYNGTDARDVGETSATMNFGFFSNTTKEEEWGSAILHEFGHALGLKHEHQKPTGGLSWNQDVVNNLLEYQYV